MHLLHTIIGLGLENPVKHKLPILRENISDGSLHGPSRNASTSSHAALPKVVTEADYAASKV